MEALVKTTPTNSTNSHIPGIYQGSPDLPNPVAETLPLRTMKNDIGNTVKNQNESLVSMAVAEDKKKAMEREVANATRINEVSVVSTAPRPIGRIVIVVVLVLVLVGAGFAYKLLLPKISIPSFGSSSTESRPNTPTTSSVNLIQSLIKATTEKRFSVNKEAPERMFSAVANERVAGGVQGDIKNFYFYEDISVSEDTRKTVSISANKLFILTGISAPEILTRSLENTFMAGLIYEETDAVPTPFIILKVSSYDTGFAGMLEMERNLPLFFDIVFGTNIEFELSDKTKIRDVVLSSRDARVLEIATNVDIAYTFANPSTIVIASSRSALEKLIPLLEK